LAHLTLSNPRIPLTLRILAISTLLQPPIVRTGLVPQTGPFSSGFKAPTARDIPPVALTNIPHIESETFQPYLSQIGSLYEAFQRAKEDGDGESQLFRRDRKEARGEDPELILNAGLQRPAHSRAGSTTSPIGTPFSMGPLKRRTSGQRRQHAVTPLSTIPPVYLEDDFHLENPRTFDIVSERSEIVRDPKDAPSGRKALATNAILQEKLSWYLDTVEIHLISSISTASKSFFSALGSLRELHAEAADSIARIQSLRKDLAKLDKEMAMSGLKVLNLKQRRDNVRQLAEAIQQLRDIVALVTKCEEMVDKDEIEDALDNLDDVEDMMSGIPCRHTGRYTQKVPGNSPLRDLRRIKALQGASDDLGRLRYRISKGFEMRFLNSLLGDIRGHVQKVPPEVTLQRWNSTFGRLRAGQRRTPSVFPAYMSIDPLFRSELQSQLGGLSRSRHTMPAATTFKASVLRELRNMIRKHLPSSNDDDNDSMMSASTMGGRQINKQEKSSILARNLRSLDPEDAYAMLMKIYAGVSEGLRRLSVQVKILLDITSGMGNGPNDTKPPPKSPTLQAADGTLTKSPPTRRRATSNVQAELQQVLDLSSLLDEAVEKVQSDITKVVRIRSEQTAQISLVDFLRFFNLNRLFADECEAICGRSGVPLKTVVDKQIKDFVSQFVNGQRRDLVEVMDADKWDAKDFGEAENIILRQVLDGSTTDAPSWRYEANNEPTTNGVLPNGDAPVTNGKDKIRSATVDEQRFILPDSAIAILRTMEHFLHLTAGIPSMGQEIANGLLECLKLFNSRCSQLILGAGATRSAGLKNITTKHLALSSQALSFVIALIPYIREFIRRHLPTSSALQVIPDFDKVKRLFQEHQHGIHEKLVEIMSSRASVHVNAMKKIDWEQAAQDKSVAVSAYIETLMKETATLQKVLAKHLPEGIVNMIMQPIFQSYREQWSRAYGEVTLRSVAAKERYVSRGSSSLIILGRY
jgi:vacuolar protein sorting-associated protein 54